MFKKIINHFFSFSCPCCKTESPNDNFRFCEACVETLSIVQPPYCPSCGGTLDGALEVCSKCLREDETPWYSAIAAMNMSGQSRELIQRLKYKNDTSLIRPIAYLALDALEKSNITYDLITPVPLHWARKLSRGYNQSALLAQQIAKITKTKYKNLLFRKRYTLPQTKLSGEQRRKNLKNVFAVRDKRDIVGKSILLVDDVFTTGSTLRATATTILKNNAKEVSVLVLARR